MMPTEVKVVCAIIIGIIYICAVPIIIHTAKIVLDGIIRWFKGEES